MNGMRMLFGKATISTPPPLFCIWAQPGTQSATQHKWTRWLHNPCRLGGPQRFRAGGKNRSGPQVGKVAT